MKEILLRVRISEDATEQDQKIGIEELIHTIEDFMIPNYHVVDAVSIVKEKQVHLEVIRDKKILSSFKIEEPALLIQSERVQFIEPKSKISLHRIERILEEMAILEEKKGSIAIGVRMLNASIL